MGGSTETVHVSGKAPMLEVAKPHGNAQRRLRMSSVSVVTRREWAGPYRPAGHERVAVFPVASGATSTRFVPPFAPQLHTI